MTKNVRLLSVSSVDLALNKSNPPTLVVAVAGIAATPGYKNVRLEVTEGDELSPDGILDLELVGEPPKGIVPQMLTPAHANIIIERDVDRIVGVIVHARTNSMTAMLGLARQPERMQAMDGAVGLTPLPDGPNWPWPWPWGPRFPPHPWPPYPKTMALGEDGPWTMAMIGGEGSGPYFVEKDPRTETMFAQGGVVPDPRDMYFGRNPFGGR